MARDHRQIIADAGGVTYLSRCVGVKHVTVQSWQARNRIPANVWADMAEQGLATLEELAGAVRRTHVAAITWQTSAEGAWTVTIPPGISKRDWSYAMAELQRRYRAENP